MGGFLLPITEAAGVLDVRSAASLRADEVVGLRGHPKVAVDVWSDLPDWYSHGNFANDCTAKRHRHRYAILGLPSVQSWRCIAGNQGTGGGHVRARLVLGRRQVGH